MSLDIKLHFIDEVLGTYVIRTDNISSMSKGKRLKNSMSIIIQHRNKVSLVIFLQSVFKIIIKYFLYRLNKILFNNKSNNIK